MKSKSLLSQTSSSSFSTGEQTIQFDFRIPELGSAGGCRTPRGASVWVGPLWEGHCRDVTFPGHWLQTQWRSEQKFHWGQMIRAHGDFQRKEARWKSKWLHGVWLFETHGLYSPCNSPGWNTGMGSHSFLQGIFPTQRSNPGLPHCSQIFYQLSHKRSPRILECIAYPFSSRPSWPRNRIGVSCIAGGFFTSWGGKVRKMFFVYM